MQPIAGADALSLAGFASAAALYAIFAWRLRLSPLLGEHRMPVARLFVAALGLTALWAAAVLVDGFSIKRVTWHVALGLDHLRYGAWFVFLKRLTSPQRTLREALFDASATSWFALALAAASIGVNLYSGFALADAGEASRPVAALLLGWAVLATLLVEQLLRNQGEASLWAAKPLCLGLGALFFYDIYLSSQGLMFARLDVDAAAARGWVQVVGCALLVVASRRHSQWLSKVQLSNAAAFYSASLLLVGGYLLAMAAAGYYVRLAGGTWGGALRIALLFAATVLLGMLIGSGSARARVRVFLGKNFLRYRYDYRVEWRRFTAMLSTRVAPQEMGSLVVRGLADLVESPGGALWTRVPGHDHLEPTAAWNFPLVAPAAPGRAGAEAPGARVAFDSPLCVALREREWIFRLREARPLPVDVEANAAVPEWLATMTQAWLAVPLSIADELIGFVVLAAPRTPLEVDWEVRDVLKTAARQAAAFLAQMQAAEALLEARKFDAFNRMSAFVVHDLKNIVTQLSLMLRNAERHRDNPEFQDDMLATVGNSLERMRQLMTQLREGNPPAGSAAGVALRPIAERLVAQARQRGRRVELLDDERIATRGHPDRLERVLGHVVQNALDATPSDGRVWLRLYAMSGRSVVEVGDSGVGMTPEFVRDRLFRPFNSTKTSGMGIGTYESFQYVRELGGQIDVDTAPGRGTTVRIELPSFELHRHSDLSALGSR